VHGINRNRTRVRIRNPVCALSLFVTTATFVPTQQLAAGFASASLAVTARVLRTCSLSASSLSIANYDPSIRIAAADHTASTELTVVCKRGATSAITVGAGSNAPGVVTSRVTFSEGDKLRHEAYKNSGPSQLWSESASDVLYHSTTDGTAPQSISVYRRIPGSQLVGAGSYVDTVLYTINF
jgi:spore coat protein U-like protein